MYRFLFILFMLSAAMLPAQAVLEIAAEEVCWTNNSVETSLTRYVLLSSRTPSSSQVIAYVDATGAIVDPTVGGTITLGYCGCCNEAGGGDDDWRYYYPNSPTNTNPIWRYGRVVIGNVSTPDTSHVLQLYGNFEFKPDTTFTRLSWPIQETGKNTPYYGLLLESSAGETGTSFAGGRNHFTIATHNTVFEKTRLGALAFAGNNPNDTDLKLSAFLEAAANGAWSSTNTGSNITVYVTQNNTLTPHAVASFAHDGRFQLGKYANFNDGVPTSLIGHQTGTSNLSRHPISGTAGAGKVPAINATNTGLEWVTPAGGGGISDGNKGDITVSNNAATFTINNAVVSNAKLATDAVTADKIAADAVTSSEIAAGAVNTSEIADSSVTAAKLPARVIDESKLSFGSVGNNQLTSTGVTAGNYNYANLTVNAQGRVTAASSGVTPLTGFNSANNIAYYTAPGTLGGTSALTYSNSTLSVNSEAIFNDGGFNRNFRIESSDLDHIFYVDAANNTIGINQNLPSTASILDIASTTRGLLIPRMTTTQRNGITSPPGGLMIYNTTTQTLDTYNSVTSSWVSLSGGGGGSTPSGSSGQIQFNNAGAFGASANLFWDATDSELGVGTSAPTARIHAVGSGTTSSASGLLIEDIAARDLLRVDNAGRIEIAQNTTVTTQNTAVITNATANSSLVIAPNGAGALIADIPTGDTLGGNERGWWALDLQMRRTAATQVASGQYSAIIGGQNNTASGLRAIAGGDANNVTSQNGIGLGSSNTVSGFASVAIGRLNTVSGAYGTAFGFSNQIDATPGYAIATGINSRAYLEASIVHAGSNIFGVNGDAQHTLITFRRAVTGTGQSELFLDGGAVRAILLGTNRIWNANVQCTAGIATVGNGTVTIGGAIVQTFDLGIKRLGTNTSLIGSVATSLNQADAGMGGATFTVDADDTNEALRIQFTPPTNAGSTTVTRCFCVVKLSEVGL